MSPPTTQDPMSILQGVQNVYMHQPTITMTNNNVRILHRHPVTKK